MSRKTEGILIVLSGFSGGGKGTVMKALLEQYPEDYALSISATTRSPRAGEKDGREYFFKTREAFEQMIVDEQLLEYAEYVGNYYGTPLSYVEEQMRAGKNVILEIEMQGALKVKERFPDTLLLFLTPPDVEELIKRLRGRGTEDEETINARLTQAIKESAVMDKYDYLVINDQLDDCVEEIHHIISSEQQKMTRNREKVETFSQGLKGYLKGES